MKNLSLLLSAIALCLLSTGCISYCDGYAPSGISISWTGYNTVAEVEDYFRYYNTGQMHATDTVLISGYLLHNNDTAYYRNLIDTSHEYIVLMMTDDPTSTNGHGIPTISLLGDSISMRPLLGYKNGQMVYLKANCSPSDPAYQDACHFLVVANIISIDKIE